MNPLFIYANYAEAGLWVVIGIVVAIFGRSRFRYALFAFLVLFGFSDVVEVQTGAWYRPWWLFAWKACCVLAIASLGYLEVKSRRTVRA